MFWLQHKLKDSSFLNAGLIFRADSDGLSEQKRLEGLITRYKAMIPVIESTMVKIDIYTKAYSFREEINKVNTDIQSIICGFQDLLLI